MFVKILVRNVEVDEETINSGVGYVLDLHGSQQLTHDGGSDLTGMSCSKLTVIMFLVIFGAEHALDDLSTFDLAS